MSEPTGTQVVLSTFPGTGPEIAYLDRVAECERALLEVRLDHWQGTTDELSEALSSVRSRLIVTDRPPDQGGHSPRSPRQRAEMLHAAALWAEYVDLEADAPFRREPFGDAKKILSWHDFQATPQDPLALARRMHQDLPEALIKVAFTPRSAADLLSILSLPHQAGFPVCAMAMGERGRLSRALAGRMGSPLVYASAPGQSGTAPGQFDADLMDMFRVDEQGPDTPVDAVVGRPLGHSLSPSLHNISHCALDLDRVYVPLETDTLDEALLLAEALKIEGLSVTLPFKEEAARMAVGWLPGHQEFAKVGAANTLVHREDGWWAANTDAAGFLHALRAAVPDLDLDGTNVLVLGAGGVARTAVAVLQHQGARIAVTSRTRRRAQTLARDFGVRVLPFSHDVPAEAQVVINATPVGMYPNDQDSPLPEAHFREDMVVYDLIYRPRRTRLLRQARAAGCRTVDGSAMFLHQAALQYELFTGRSADLEAMENVLREALADPDAPPPGPETP